MKSRLIANLRRPRAKAGFVVVIGNLAGAGAAFLAAVIAARVLDLDEFAAFGVGLAVNSLAVQFGDLGMGVVAMAEASEAKTISEARAKLKALTLHRVATSTLAMVIIEIVILLLPSLEPYRGVAMIGAAGGAFGGITMFAVANLQAHGRFTSAGVAQTAQGAFRLLFILACAISGFGASMMMLGYAILAPVVTGIYAGFVLMRALKLERDGAPIPVAAPEAGPNVDGSRQRMLAVAGILGALTINGDVLLLTMFGSEADVAQYAAAWRIGAGMLLINTAIAGAFFPFIMKAGDAWFETRRLMRIGSLVVAGWLVLTPVIYVIGPILLGSIGEDAKGPLLVLTIAFALDGFYFVIYGIYLRIRRPVVFLGAAAVQLTTMVLVTLLLQDQGAMAPAWGQLASGLMTSAFVVAPIILNATGRIDWFSEGEPDPALEPEPELERFV